MPIYTKKFTYSDNADAMFKLGELYFGGTIAFFKNYKMSFKYFRSAAEYGHIRALYNIGDMYYKGLGVKKNRQLAAEYWQKHELAYKKYDNNTLAGFYWKELPVNIPIQYDNDAVPSLKYPSYSHMPLEYFKKLYNIQDRIKYYREFNIPPSWVEGAERSSGGSD
ncbi:MAG: hypothetical protein L3J71_15405 [Victivallaceae bacterium]|nr:hypothetical protein [Victivallaceae bacterium]